MIARATALTAALLAALVPSAWADGGGSDPGFNGGQPLVVSEGTPGAPTGLAGVAEQADGKIDVTGATTGGSWFVLQYLPNGQLDPGFGSQGMVTLNLGGQPSGIALQPDGKVLVGGIAGSGSSTTAEFLRLDPSGSLDGSFGGTGEVGLSIAGKTVTGTHHLTIDPTGNCYLSGDVVDSGTPTQQGFIAAVDPSGKPASWGPGGFLFPGTGTGIDPSIAAAVPAGGTVFYAGQAFDNSFASHAFLGAVSASTGDPVTTFGSGGVFLPPTAGMAFTDLLMAGDGKLKATGFAPSGSSTGALVASFNETGADPRDAGFGQAGLLVVGGAADQPNNGNAITEAGGTLFAGATNISAGGGTQQSIVAVDEKTGGAVPGWGTGGFITYPIGAKSFSTSIASGDGKLFLGGQTEPTSGANAQGSLQVVDAPTSGTGGGGTGGGGTGGTGGGGTGGGGTPPSNNPCSIQPKPPVTPPVQRPCADIAISAVIPGLWLENDREETDDLNALLHGFIAVPVAVSANQKDSGFRRFNFWQVGESVEFEVAVANNGDDTGRFTIDVPAGFTYAGQLVPGLRQGDIDLARGTIPSSIAAHQSLRLVFRAQLTKEGPLTFTASINGTPTDPVATNNHGAETIAVKPRTIVPYGVRFSAGELSGGSAEAHKSGDGPGAARDKPPRVDIALVRVRQNRCQWLRNARGMLSKGTRTLPCGAPVWLKTTARRSGWTYKLAAVPPRDTYLVLVRPRGANVAEFGFRLGNLFRVRLP